jgi:hypothetical protein
MVTATDPRYTEWTNHKPSKRAKLQEKILSAPGEYVKGRAAKIAEDSAKHVAVSVLRAAAPVAIAGSRTVAGAILGSAVATGVAATALIGGAIYAMQKIGEHLDVSDGEKINSISRTFVDTQQKVMAQYRVRSWDAVPADVRNKLVSGYKSAISGVTAYRRGYLKPSAMIPYGR